MSDKYVQLNRRFRSVEREQSPLPSSLVDVFGNDETWEDLAPVAPPTVSSNLEVVVILASSGSGKTAELKARSSILRLAGVNSFFLRALDVVTGGVENSIDDKPSFISWRESDARAVFFIDAIDEVRLRGQDLESVLRLLREEVVAPAWGRVRLVISSRNDLWAADYNRQFADLLARGDDGPVVRAFNLTELSHNEVRLYVEARGISDPAAFMAAFEEDELGEISHRPPDVGGLIDYWKEHGYFGTRSEMIEVSIEASLREDNQRHASQRQITLEDARRGLMRVGATTILGKRQLITTRRTASNEVVNAGKLFSDQRSIWVEQFLAMGIFVHKGLQAVQLTLGPFSNYLAAQWIAERMKRGWDPLKLEEILFATPLGEQRERIPPSRVQLAAWVAGNVPELRERMARHHPHVLLFEGDPAMLSRGDCIAALRSVIEELKAGGKSADPDRWSLRQIATHQLEDLVLQWLEQVTETPAAQQLLLHLAEAGRYQAVVTHALALAFSPNSHEQVITAAIRVVALNGTELQREQLLALTNHSSEWVRLELIRMLAPGEAGGHGILHGAALVQMILAIRRRDVTTLIEDTLVKISFADVEAILHALQPSIVGSISDSHTEARLHLACKLALQWLQRSVGNVAEWMLSLLLGLERHLGWGTHVSRRTLTPLKRFLSENQVLRQRLWEARVAEAGAAHHQVAHDPDLGEVQAEDIEWLSLLYAKTGNSSQIGSLAFARSQALSKMPQQARVTLARSAQVALGLRSFLEQEEARDRERADGDRQREAEEQREKEGRLTRNIAELQPLRAGIEAGLNLSWLKWAWRQLDDDSHYESSDREHSSRRRRSWSRSGFHDLQELVGPDLAGAFAAGFQRRWRMYEPPLSSKQLQSNEEIDVGLTGLKLEIEGGLNLASLSDLEAERAARYAVYEINGLPPWFDELRKKHPAIVRSILAGRIFIEWRHTADHLGVIARAPYEPPGTAELLRDLVMAQLEQQEPAHVNTVGSAIRALLLPTKPARDFAPVLQRYVIDAAASNSQMLPQWLRGWSHFAPLAAAQWLTKFSRVDLARFHEVVATVCDLLEEDFAEVIGVVSLHWEVDALKAWVQVLYPAVDAKDDREHSKEHDRVQEFRSRCIHQLARDPSPAASAALRQFRGAKAMLPYRAWLDGRIEDQLNVAAEHLAKPWDEESVLTVERGDERQPKSNAELFAMVRRHLARVRELLENDDFSYAKLFDEDEDEREVQCWVASSLKLVSRGLYTVEREPQVQDDKRMDIVITVPGVGRVPVEIKPLYKTRYTYTQLQAFVSDQLVGRYMRPPVVERGIFLLVPLKVRTWRVNKRTLTFNQMLEKLGAYASEIGRKKFREVVVEHINIAEARP